MSRHELSDDEWGQIKDLFPVNGRRGRPWRDHRVIMNGIVWILETGAPWRDLPKEYGPWQTVYDRFNRWRKDGTWIRILQHLRAKLEANGSVDWEQWCVDSSSVRGSRAAAGAGKKGVLTNRKIMA